jgi:hypothetical protein
MLVLQVPFSRSSLPPSHGIELPYLSKFVPKTGHEKQEFFPNSLKFFSRLPDPGRFVLVKSQKVKVKD